MPEERHPSVLAEAEDAFRRREYGVAISLLESIRGPDAARAQTRLGQVCLLGLGVEPDPVRAIALFESASASGDPKAALELARLCDPTSTYADSELERIRPKDGERSHALASRAVEGLEREARARDGEAAFLLSQCYQAGFGVNRSMESAVMWLEFSFAIGFAIAANELFAYYSQSWQPFHDPERALLFYRAADAAGVRVVFDPVYERLLRGRN
jgi:TPR repeat protein